MLGQAYHYTGQYRKEEKLYKKAEQDFPSDYRIIRQQAILALSKGKSKAANGFLDKYLSIRKEAGVTEAGLAANIASIYDAAGILDKAEEHYRKALSLQPENLNWVYSLTWFLIDKDRNVDEGLELTNKALELNPDDWHLLDTKGWGLYKQGKYQEAYNILQKSWDLRLDKAVYDHEAFLHLETAKKAVANQKGAQ